MLPEYALASAAARLEFVRDKGLQAYPQLQTPTSPETPQTREQEALELLRVRTGRTVGNTEEGSYTLLKHIYGTEVYKIRDDMGRAVEVSTEAYFAAINQGLRDVGLNPPPIDTEIHPLPPGRIYESAKPYKSSTDSSLELHISNYRQEKGVELAYAIYKKHSPTKVSPRT